MSVKNNVNRRIITGVVTGFALLQLTSYGGKIPNASNETSIEGEVLQNNDEKRFKNILKSVEIEQVRQQLYRDFATQYCEIIKSDLPEFQKHIDITRLTEKVQEAENLLKRARSLSEISFNDRKRLGIKKPVFPEVDEKLINALVSMYARRIKMPNMVNRGIDTLSKLTIREDENLDDIDTSEFEEALRQYFTEHYWCLFSTSIVNVFLDKITEMPDGLHDEYGDLTQMAMEHGIGIEDVKELDFFGCNLIIQDSLIAEEYLSTLNVFYATPDGINKRINDIFSKILYLQQRRDALGLELMDNIELLKAYFDYANKNKIRIINPDVLEFHMEELIKDGKMIEEIGLIEELDEELEVATLTEAEAKALCIEYEKVLKNSCLIEFGDDEQCS